MRAEREHQFRANVGTRAVPACGRRTKGHVGHAWNACASRGGRRKGPTESPPLAGAQLARSHRPAVSSEMFRSAARETGAVHFFARSRCGPLAQNSTDVQKWSRAHTATLGSRVLAGSSFRSGCDVEMRSTEVAQSSHQLRGHSQAS